jgi:hypothetical protein
MNPVSKERQRDSSRAGGKIERLTSELSIDHQTEYLAWRELLLRDLPWVVARTRSYHV